MKFLSGKSDKVNFINLTIYNYVYYKIYRNDPS